VWCDQSHGPFRPRTAYPIYTDALNPALPPEDHTAYPEIDQLAQSFFGAFANRDGAPDLDILFGLFVPAGLISQRSGDATAMVSIAAFIEPRRALLSNGTLTDFSEEELSNTTDVFGDVAQRTSAYRKSGRRDGVSFTTLGRKFFQFVRTPDGWRIASVVWDDERQA